MSEIKILVVEDDNTLRETLQYNLEKEGYTVSLARDGGEALNQARAGKPDLMLLDLMLPVMDGLEVCRVLRSEMQLPVIMLTAKTEEVDKVVGLELGADDYVTKPFSMRELHARIKAVLRRVGEKKLSEATVEAGGEIIKAGNFEVDTSRHSVYKGGNPVELNPKEFELLAYLMANKGQVMSREQILHKVWGYEYIGNDRTVDVHMRWLRQKLEADAENPQHLMTVRGYGYKFQA
jgi:two-component system, OmpR family, response regulator